jgi:hypothetical protein
MNMKPICIALLLVILNVGVNAAVAQVSEAREAIERGEYVRAVNILAAELAERPSADTYLYLGIAYGHMKEYEKAQEVLIQGSAHYPDDARFHNELAGVHLANNDVDTARSDLERALSVDPTNDYASDLLATIDMSQGEVQAALRFWNKSGRPVIDDIMHNYYLTFGSWVVRKAVAFHPAGVLRYGEWKTTESRLLETDNFTNVGIEIEPTRVPEQYNAVVRTTTKTNMISDVVFGLFKGLPAATSYFDLWNIGNSGLNFNSSYRWDADRRRAEGRLKAPLPLGGLFQVEIGDAWRSERWDATSSIRSEHQSKARFNYKANSLRLRVKHIPYYRFEIAGGFEYRNRAASGSLPELGTDSRNTAKFTVETDLRFADDRYQNRLHLEGFAARPSVLGDMHFSGGITEFHNRFTISKDTRTALDWSLRAATARGRLPFEDYFMLGMEVNPRFPLRGHAVADGGRYGSGPMGTDFLLANVDLERRLATVPLFNTFNIPFLTVKWEVFVDAAKTFDRNRIFKQGKLWVDAGGGLRFETPTHSLNLIMGRSLRDGTGILMGYVERRLW